MASLTSPLNRFRRRRTHHQPLHERWGDVSISAPTDGSWNQYQYRSHRAHAHAPSHQTDDLPPHAGTVTHPVRSALNSRRLSVRLKSRPSPRDQQHSETVHTASFPSPSPSFSSSSSTYSSSSRRHSTHPDTRSDFIYKPVTRPDYPTVVAEKSTSENRTSTGRQSSPRVQYRPTTTRYADETSLSRQYRYHSHGDFYDEDEYDDSYDEEGSYYRDNKGNRNSANDAGQRGLSVLEKRRSRAARRLTTVMVPNAEDIYG